MSVGNTDDEGLVARNLSIERLLQAAMRFKPRCLSVISKFPEPFVVLLIVPCCLSALMECPRRNQDKNRGYQSTKYSRRELNNMHGNLVQSRNEGLKRFQRMS